MYFGLELHVHTFSAGETHTHEHTQIVLWAHLHINRFIFWPKKRRKTSNANPFHGQTDTNTLHSLTSAPWRLSPNPTQPHTTPRNPTQPHATPRNPTQPHHMPESTPTLKPISPHHNLHQKPKMCLNSTIHPICIWISSKNDIIS